MDNGPKSRRSRTGCLTCRGRKVRCDEEHPICRACTRLRLSCVYVSPGKTVDNNRKAPRSRRPRFRVRFVDPNASRFQNVEAGLDAGARRTDGPMCDSVPLNDLGELSPSASGSLTGPRSLPSPAQRRQHGRNCYTSPRSPLIWSGDSSSSASPPDELPNETGTPGPPPDYRNCWLGDTVMPEDVEGMLDSMGFEADIGLLWDSMSAFATNDVETGVSASITVNDGQERRGHIEATVDAGPSLASSVSLGATAAGQMVTMRSEDREPLQHYLSTMVQFAKIRSSAADNIYCYIFTNMGLTHAPLYESILAWAALHLAHVKSSTTADAETRYQRASALLFDDLDAAGHVELTLVTVWFLLQYELFSAKGVDGFIRLLSYAADIVEGVFQVGHLSDIKQQLGPVGVRVLMWLSAYDGRAASFGNPCRLLRCLKMHPSVYNIIDNHGQGTSVDPMRAPIEFATAELRACLRLALRLNILKGSCLLLGRWRDDNMEHDAAWAALYSSLQTIKEEVEDPKVPAAKLAMRVAEGDMNVPTAANTLEFNRMQLLATYYSTIVLYMQHCPAALPTEVTDSTLADPSWPSVRDCAARIIRLSRHVALSRPNSPQAIWPQILFQAGVETDDPIYLSWVLGAFAQAEAWGPNLRKTRQLLERVIEVRRDLKAPLDIPTLMDGMGGPFIL